MPLDFVTTQRIADIPDHLDFDVMFEPTKLEGKKYVVNGDTGDYIGIVGNDFPNEPHNKFFNTVQDVMTEKLSTYELQNADVRWRTANNNAWAMMDITLPNTKTVIGNDKHSTEVAQRVIALRAIDGSCSNQVFFGAIDFFCTNGMIRGEHDKVRRKNTSGFSVDRFANQLRRANEDFILQTQQLNRWANKSLMTVDVKGFLEKLMGSDRAAEKMFSLYNQEVSVRGRNVFALYSAFTNYATYADERNGFQMRRTGNDTGAITMFKRENEVAKWISSPKFQQIAA